MGTILGLMLVLASWFAGLCFLVVIGLLPATLVRGRAISLPTLRHAVWWGLTIVAILALLVNNLVPLGSATAALVFLGLTLVLLLAIFTLYKARVISWEASSHRLKNGKWAGLLSTSLLLAVVYFAIAALGRVTNYDSGLYHLGAVEYSRVYSVVPGLANLNAPFGYSNAEFPLAALFGNGPWQAEGFRLINGFLALLLVIDFIIRTREKNRSAGYFVLLAGLVTAFVPMLILSDYWVTSPSQDSAILFLTVVVTAYLADIVMQRNVLLTEVVVVALLSILLFLLRPTMIAFALGVFSVIVIKVFNNRKQFSAKELVAPSISIGVIAAIAGIAITVRDYFLSGWLQYPLSIFHFDVSWLAPDPVQLRLATLGYHRNPSDLWNSATGFGWVTPWIHGLPSHWEFYEFLGLVVVTLAVFYVARKRSCAIRGKQIALAAFPSALAVIFWWIATPPSFRFIWGPLFTCATIPLGMCIWRLSQTRSQREFLPKIKVANLIQAGSACFLMLVVIVCIPLRLHLSDNKQQEQWTLGISLPYNVTPVVSLETTITTLPSGLQVRQPVNSEQCWMVFPLCSPRVPQGLAFVDGTTQSGFMH